MNQIPPGSVVVKKAVVQEDLFERPTTAQPLAEASVAWQVDAVHQLTYAAD